MKHARVLIADNDRRVRTQLYTRLLDVDVFSDTVPAAAEALEYLRDRSYGVILLDLDLPEREAYSVIDFIRGMPAADRPIVLATAARDANPNLECDLVQIVIRKPIRLAEISEMIRSCVFSGSERKSMTGGAQSPHRSIDRMFLQ